MKSDYKSILNKEIPIHINESVLALVRKPYGINPEHVFILVESLNGFEQVTLSRYDLVMDKENDNKGQIIIKSQSVKQNEAAKALNEMLDDDQIDGKCWPISKDEALKLHQTILKLKLGYHNNPDNYNILGDAALVPKSGDLARESAPKSAEYSSTGIEYSSAKLFGHVPVPIKGMLSPSGENCYTWARKMLLSLDNQEINKEFPRSPLDLVVSIPSRHLSDQKRNKISSTCRMM